MPKSKHYGWQKRWSFDSSGSVATHILGLVCRDVGGRIVADNARDTEELLTVKNGPGNAPIMIARLLREAEAVFQQHKQDRPAKAARIKTWA